MAALEPNAATTVGAALHRILALLLAALATAVAPAGLADNAPPAPQAEFQAIADAKAKAFLGDLSARRRGAKLFRNLQGTEAGVQESFVNTTKGNLTFLMRDLVVIAPMPLVLGRVYDSVYQRQGGDFGPGWKLTVDEKIEAAGGELAFTNAANVVYRFRVAGSRLVGVGRAFPGTGTVDDDGAIILRTTGLTRRFARHGGVYRLVEAATDVGRAHLSYANGGLAAISSGTAKAHLHRRPDGRIVAIEDHLGRIVRYQYDDLGRLEALTDLAGEAWRFAYVPPAAGGSPLARMADPRGHAILEAAYADGKAASVRHLAAKATFHYGDRTTRVVDGLGRTTTFYHLASGITDAIADPLGRLAQLSFDEHARPTALRRDGVAVAKLAYDSAGRLLAIVAGPAGAAKRTAFSYGPHGLIRAIGDGMDATYRYDAQGRVAGVADATGGRSYGYDDAGRLHTITVDGAVTELAADANGATTEVRRDGELVIAYRYQPDGRVAAIDYASAGAAASYRYDKRGFRTEADYGDDVRSKLRYDGAGNLVHYEVRSPTGTATQDYAIGTNNQLLEIRNGGPGSAPSVAFEYDAAGRLLAVAAGQRHATIAHDDLDRVTAIALHGEPLLNYDYDPLAAGAIAAADRITAEVAAPPGASAVFGTLDTIVYTRPRPMEHAAVAYDPARKTLVPRAGHLAPDAALRSSLARRSIPVGKAAPGPKPFAADKPSNSLFHPAPVRQRQLPDLQQQHPERQPDGIERGDSGPSRAVYVDGHRQLHRNRRRLLRLAELAAFVYVRRWRYGLGFGLCGLRDRSACLSERRHLQRRCRDLLRLRCVGDAGQEAA